MCSSIYSRELDTADYQDLKLEKYNYPVVIVFNGVDHYVPTKPSSGERYTDYRVSKQLAPLLTGALSIIDEVDKEQVNPTKLQSINELETLLVKSIPVLAPYLVPGNIRGCQQDSAVREAAPLPQISAAEVPSSDRSSLLPPPSTEAPVAGAVPHPSANQPASKKKHGGRKPKKGGYPCHICGKARDRKSDLDGHLWNAHRVGQPIECNMGECQHRTFATKSSLNTHVKTQHRKQHTYKCQTCPYGSESHDYFVEHRIKAHGIVMRYKKSKKPIIYHCKKCGKVYVGPASLRKHVQRKMCMVKKKVECKDCGRKFKSQKGLDKHHREQHNPDHPMYECARPLCTAVLSSQESFHNHQLWHNGLDKKQRQKIAQRRKREAAALRQAAAELAGKKPKRKSQDPDYRSSKATKSTPAKLLPQRKSPRGSPRGSKGKK